MKTEEVLVSLACFAVGCVGFLLLEPGGGGVSCMGSKGCPRNVHLCCERRGYLF